MNDTQKIGHESWNIAKLAVRLLHTERLAEAEITENIKDQVVRPVCHVQRTRPFAAIFVDLLSNELAPAVEVGMDEGLSIADSLVGEGIVQYTALAIVCRRVGHVPGRHGLGAARVDSIVFGLANIGLGAEDGLETGRGVDEDAIGGVSEGRSWVCCQHPVQSPFELPNA